MTELKTKPNKQNIEDFLKKVENPSKRDDSFEILKILKEVTQQELVMWGNSIVGFGSYHYKYASCREVDWSLTGFSPRKQNLTFYIMSGFEKYDELLKNLGKFKTGKSCLYIKKLQDIDIDKLRELIIESVKNMKELYP